ncbi:unnamed protein product, partial [Ectocarpus sp. 8 AP-2014]
ASLRDENEGLRRTLASLSAELAASSKLSQDRLINCEVSARAAAEAERRSEALKRSSDEARQAAESARSLADLAEAARDERERALGAFQGSMTRALQDVEDALADALQGIGGWEPFHQGGEDYAG